MDTRTDAIDSKASLSEDRATLEAIGAIYCKAHCGSIDRDSASGLCPACAKIVDYAMSRTESCPNNHEGNCQDCPIHCYNKEMRGAIKQMMGYSAPRMVLRHPVMTFKYACKKLKAR